MQHISRPDFICIYNNLSANDGVGIDFETNGVDPYNGDTAFIMGVATNEYATSIDLSTDAHELAHIFSRNDLRYCMHQAKFELSFLKKQFNISLSDKQVWDTMVFERMMYNNYPSYSLQSCVERIGLTKYPPMLEWVKNNPKQKYSACPWNIIVPYVEQDAWLSVKLYDNQRAKLSHLRANSPKITSLVDLEMKTTHNVFDMEFKGMLFDTKYAKQAQSYEINKTKIMAELLTKKLGFPFVDSAKCLAVTLENEGIKLPRTEKDNVSISYDSLVKHRDNQIVELILNYREARKRATTYWKGLLNATRSDNCIHASINQSGTASGRFSMSEPNLQNLPDDSEGATPFPVRRAFLARHNCKIVSIDYAAMELRLIADLANETTMAYDITQNVDFHQRLADVAHVSRSVAKRLRFAALYGAGAPKLSAMLGITLEEATRTLQALERDTPKITEYSKTLKNKVRFSKTLPIFNAFGRPYYFPDDSKGRSTNYKAANYAVQGSCSDILRQAIVNCNKVLQNASVDSFIMIPIHDELVFNLHEKDLGLIPQLAHAMRSAYKGNIINMDVAIAIGDDMHFLEDYNG